MGDFTKGKTPIEKSALALLKINQLIEVGSGGNVTKNEWENESIYKWFIGFDDSFKKFSLDFTLSPYSYAHITFHTKKQSKEFLSYTENVKLLKDYFMI